MKQYQKISKAVVMRNLDDLKRRGQTGYFASISNTLYVPSVSYMKDLPSADLYERLGKAAAVMLKLPRRWQYSISAAAQFTSVFAIDANRDDFTAWLKKNHIEYTDKAKFVEWSNCPGGFWNHEVTAVISGVEVRANYAET